MNGATLIWFGLGLAVGWLVWGGRERQRVATSSAPAVPVPFLPTVPAPAAPIGAPPTPVSGGLPPVACGACGG